jgi:dihydroorotase
MDTLTLPRPDDWHLHVRDGAALASVLPHTARVFGRATLMPNLKPPVTTVAAAAAYRERALAALADHPDCAGFQPWMTLYLTDRTTPEEVRAAAASGFVIGVKLYPSGATTNSDAGVTRLDRVGLAHLAPVFAALADTGLPLLTHAEVADASVDVFDREAAFLDRVLGPLLDAHPRLRCVVEHVTTAQAVDFVRAAPLAADGAIRVAATLTPQHLLLNRNALFQGGLQPHHYCLPVLKREEHRLALLTAATSGDPRFFLGTDSAPHTRGAKEAACGCAGCFTAPHALPLYALAFERAGTLDRLADFASRFGAAFFGLPPARGEVVLGRSPQTLPASWPMADGEVVPLFAGEVLPWRVLAVHP